MPRITLQNAKWNFDEDAPLGKPGGFGAVFLGTAEDGAAVAIKRIKQEMLAHAGRELELAAFFRAHTFTHVVPILDVGFDEASAAYYIVMAKADGSLADLIDKSAPLSEPESFEIIAAIVAGLAEIDELVHRDLKPPNILLHNGVWKLADLGLARFAAASTAPNTMKDFLSAQYAAPEQWKSERATKATDVYALGCIIHELVSGSPPFPGPQQWNFSSQHQFDDPPVLPASAPLQRITSACLAKRPELRPSIASLQDTFEKLRSSGAPRLGNALAVAAAKVEAARASAEARELSQRKRESDRADVAKEAVKVVTGMLEDLLNLVAADAPNAQAAATVMTYEAGNPGIRGRGLTLGNGYIMYNIPFPLLGTDAASTKVDIVCGAMIEVGSRITTFTSKGASVISRSANVWFAKFPFDDSYQWWEAGYFYGEKMPATLKGLSEPYSIGDGHSHAGFRTGIEHLKWGGYHQLAYNPKRVAGRFFQEFCVRWSTLLAQAAVDQMSLSESLPEEAIEAKFQH